MPKSPMKLQESCLTISMGKLNESLTVYLLLVNGSEIGTNTSLQLSLIIFKKLFLVKKLFCLDLTTKYDYFHH